MTAEGSNMKLKSSITSIALIAVLVVVGVCSVVESPAAAPAPSALLLNATGATFPYIIYSKWFTEYNRIHPDIQINYNPLGSGAGIKQLQAGTVDFGASDMPLTDKLITDFKFPVLHFPTVLGAVIPTYNIQGVNAELNFTGELLADIFMGKITKWNDPKIAGQNPGITLPDQDIIVVHRSDGSGTTFIFTDYLSSVSPDWKQAVGKATSVNWPVGLGGKGNEGVSGQIKQLPGSIGYVELIYALQNQMPYADVKNAAGNYVAPTIASVTAALATANVPDDFRFSIVNAPGADAYPIAGTTWLLVYQQQKDAEKGKKLVAFLNWALTDGQKVAPTLNYAPLPASLQQRVLERIKEIKY